MSTPGAATHHWASRKTSVAIFCTIGALLAFLSHVARSTEVWLAGVDPFVGERMRPGTPSDYLQLFDDNAPWPKSAARVSTFKTSTQYLLNAPDEALRKMFSGLAKRKIKLAFEGLMIPRPANCGRGVEGYSAEGAIRAAVERTKRLGGVIDSIAMDEPLWYGHRQSGPNTCKSSIGQVAQAVARNVSAVEDVFPGVRIGDTEPMDVNAPEAWIDEIMEFAVAYQVATGRPLDFFHADIDWNQSWETPLSLLSQRLHAAQIPFGLIYDGDPEDSSDEQWTADATSHFEAVESGTRFNPEIGVLQTWMMRPTHMLPETKIGTMTNLVLQYVRQRSRFVMETAHGNFTARLLNDTGKPIAGVPVSINAVDAGNVPRITLRKVQGTVPATATKALVMLRLNNVSNCSRPIKVRIGSAQYTQEDGVSAFATLSGSSPGIPNSPKMPGYAEFSLPRAKTLAANSETFNVTSNKKFSLEIPVGATPGAAKAGYAAIVFLDPGGTEVHRREIALSVSRVTLSSGRTNRSGAISLTIPSDADLWIGAWAATYLGNDRWRGSANQLTFNEELYACELSGKAQ